MNLDKLSARTTLAPLAPAEWSMAVERDGKQFTAVVKRSSAVMCRLSLVRPDDNEEAARSALADKARFWIHDYIERAASQQMQDAQPNGVGPVDLRS